MSDLLRVLPDYHELQKTLSWSEAEHFIAEFLLLLALNSPRALAGQQLDNYDSKSWMRRHARGRRGRRCEGFIGGNALPFARMQSEMHSFYGSASQAMRFSDTGINNMYGEARIWQNLHVDRGS